jgi:hypothetical protein
MAINSASPEVLPASPSDEISPRPHHIAALLEDIEPDDPKRLAPCRIAFLSSWRSITFASFSRLDAEDQNARAAVVVSLRSGRDQDFSFDILYLLCDYMSIERVAIVRQ